MFGIYVKVRVSTFQRQTIRHGIHWEKHQRSHKQVMALFTGNPAACQAVPVGAEHVWLGHAS